MSLTKEQLALRKTGISGSDIASVCGLSEYRSALDVWRDKTSDAEPEETTTAMKRGIYLEDGIRRWYADEVGATKVEVPETITLAGQPRIMATPDGIAFFGPPLKDVLCTGVLSSSDVRGLEIKAPGRYAERGWGEPGTDQVPQAYLCQGVFEMAVLDVERLDFAALLGGELRIYPVLRNRKVESYLIERALAFWRDHVETRKPPTPTWRERDQQWIQDTFPKDKAPARDWASLSPVEQADVQNWLVSHGETSAAKRATEEYEARVKMALGDASGIVDLPSELGVTRVDWKANASAAVAWKKVAEAVRDGVAWDEAVKTNIGTPARPLVPRRMKSKEE